MYVFKTEGIPGVDHEYDLRSIFFSKVYHGPQNGLQHYYN